MDDIDRKLLKLLSKNGRISHEKVSKLFNLSRPAIHQRIKKLEEKGIIKGYHASINWRELGYQMKVLIFIKFEAHSTKRIIEEIMKIKLPNVFIEDFYRVAGEWCSVIKVWACTPDDITRLIDELCTIQGVRETSTTFILSTLFEHEGDNIK